MWSYGEWETGSVWRCWECETQLATEELRPSQWTQHWGLTHGWIDKTVSQQCRDQERSDNREHPHYWLGLVTINYLLDVNMLAICWFKEDCFRYQFINMYIINGVVLFSFSFQMLALRYGVLWYVPTHVVCTWVVCTQVECTLVICTRVVFTRVVCTNTRVVCTSVVFTSVVCTRVVCTRVPPSILSTDTGWEWRSQYCHYHWLTHRHPKHPQSDLCNYSKLSGSRKYSQ